MNNREVIRQYLLGIYDRGTELGRRGIAQMEGEIIDIDEEINNYFGGDFEAWLEHRQQVEKWEK